MALLLFFSLSVIAQQDSENSHWQEALFHHARHDYPQALFFLEKIPASKRTCDMLELKADCYMQSKHLSSAIEILESAPDSCSLSYESYVNLGSAYFNLGDPYQASKYYQIAFVMVPGGSELCFNLGLCQYMIGQTAKAKKFLKLSIEENPSDLDPYDLLIQIFNEQGQTDSSMVWVKKLKKHPDKARVLLIKAFVFSYQGKSKESLGLMQKVVEMEGADEQTRFNARYNRYQILYELGRKDEACHEYRLLRKEFPFEAVELLGECE